MRISLTAALLGINLAAVISAAGVVGFALSEPDLPRPEPNPRDTAPKNPLIFAPVSGDAQSNQPLFTPSRRPPSSPERNESIQIPLPAPPRLVGIIEEGTNVRRVLLETAGGESPRLTQVGEMFEGWLVAEIHPPVVTLTRALPSDPSNDGSELSIRLFPSSQPPASNNE